MLVVVGWFLSREIVELMDATKFGSGGGDSDKAEGIWGHIRELTVDYPVLTMVMVLYH